MHRATRPPSPMPSIPAAGWSSTWDDRGLRHFACWSNRSTEQPFTVVKVVSVRERDRWRRAPRQPRHRVSVLTRGARPREHHELEHSKRRGAEAVDRARRRRGRCRGVAVAFYEGFYAPIQQRDRGPHRAHRNVRLLSTTGDKMAADHRRLTERLDVLKQDVARTSRRIPSKVASRRFVDAGLAAGRRTTAWRCGSPKRACRSIMRRTRPSTCRTS